MVYYSTKDELRSEKWEGVFRGRPLADVRRQRIHAGDIDAAFRSVRMAAQKMEYDGKFDIEATWRHRNAVALAYR
jgi:hypothetical protein